MPTQKFQTWKLNLYRNLLEGTPLLVVSGWVGCGSTVELGSTVGTGPASVVLVGFVASVVVFVASVVSSK